MKPSITRFVFLSIIFLLFSASTNVQEQNTILAFGAVKHNDRKISGVSVKVFQEARLIKEIVTGRNVGYGFALDYNSEYKIEIVKEGYLKEIIHINTTVPPEVISLGDRILWEPDFVIYKIMPGLGHDEFERPVASYIFNEELWGFFEDVAYQEESLPYMATILDNLKELEKDAYLSKKSKGDSLYALEKYEEAIIAYNQAQVYSSDNKSIDNDIKTAKKLLKKKINAEDAYQKAVEKGNDLFEEANFEEANEYYQKALIYKPKELYPLDRLYAIDSIKSYEWIKRINRYDKLLTDADSLMLDGDYELTETFLKDARELFPEKKQAGILLEKLDSIREDQQKSERELAKKEVRKDTADTEKPRESSPLPNLLDQKGKKLNQEKVRKDPAPIAESQEEVEEKIVKDVKADKVSQIIEEETIEYEISAADTSSFIGISQAELNENNPDENLKLLEAKLQSTIKSGDKQSSSRLLEEMGQIYQNDYRHQEALESFNQSLEMKREIGDKSGEIDALSNIGSVMFDSGSYNEAIQKFELSLDLSEELDDKQKSSEILANIATVLESTFRYDEAIEQLEKSKKLKEETGDKAGISDVHKSIGSIYYEENKFDKAAAELETAISIERKLENTDEVAAGLNSLGAAYYKMKQYDIAERKYEEALEITEETNNVREKSISLNNIGNINFSLNNFTKAIEYYEQSLALKKDMKFDRGVATSLYNIGNAHFKLNEFDKALEYFTASMDAARESKYFEIVWLNYEAFARTYAARGEYRKAFENYKLYTTSKFESADDNLQLVEMREQYESNKIAVKNLRRELQKQSRIARYEAETNKRDLEIVVLEVENKRQQLKRQRIAIIAFIIVSVLTLLFSLLITKQYQLTKKAYKIVADQKRNITEGINYAARIQRAVSPPEKYVQSLLPQHFILNKPCEIVGGDFFWVAKHHEKTVVAVSDCTGHGVPGGFMSMLGVALLNEILSTEKKLETHDILTQLRSRVVESLHQKAVGSEALDGMDITLIMIDPDGRSLQFSAAYHSLYVIKNGEFEKIKGDRVPIGFHHKVRPFTSKKLQLSSGDMIYLTTDGYTDQIGEKTLNRFMFGPFKDQLMAIKDKPLEEQKSILDKAHVEWRGGLPQTDDIMVMGIRI